MIELIGGAVFKDMIVNASSAIEKNKREINELNVFPVPDGDTGTNMGLTMGAAAAELMKSAPDHLGRAAEKAAASLLRSARGNSGVILSLLFRGFARSLKDKEAADGAALAAALTEGVEAAYKAVMKPAEGTVLTVSRLAAAAAREAAYELPEKVLTAAVNAGHEALADTINLNPVLKKAGVIDAGGKGYMLILEGMLDAVRGIRYEPAAPEEQAVPAEAADFREFDTGDILFCYCTELIVARENERDAKGFLELLSALGDSVVLVDDEEIIKLHVHTNDPGAVITEALKYGSLENVKIENMRIQHTEKIAEMPREEKIRDIAAPEKRYGVVAVCAGAGMEGIFFDLGADGVVTGGQTMNPSTEDILAAVDATPAEVVYVLPNNKNIIMAAELCVPLTEKQVVVLPTATVPQGISALLSLDMLNGDVGENTRQMTEAAGKVHTIQVTHAVRDSDFDGTEIKEGDYIALLESSLLCADRDLDRVMEEIVEAMKAFSPEFITIFAGEDAPDGSHEKVGGLFEGSFPGAEVTTVDGGQPVYYYMISAER